MSNPGKVRDWVQFRRCVKKKKKKKKNIAGRHVGIVNRVLTGPTRMTEVKGRNLWGFSLLSATRRVSTRRTFRRNRRLRMPP